MVRRLALRGKNPCQIARLTKIPRSTIRDWLKPRYQRRPRSDRPTTVDFGSIPSAEYSYLLGFYLGDGCLSLGRRGVYRLRIKTDSRYPKIITECAAAMQAVMPQNRVHIQQMPYRAVEIGCSSKMWPLLFPQHGPGRKHLRKIELAPWQQEIVDRYPREFLRGLIHSDGCRSLNRVNGKVYPRYLFSQVSDDIRGIFTATCDRLGIRYTHNDWKQVSIARAPSVALLDSFIGPKA